MPISRVRSLGALLGLLLLLLLLAGCWFMRRYFGALTLQQVLVHLQHGGLEQADPALALRAVRYVVVTLLLLVPLALVHRRLGPRGRRVLWVALGGGAVWSVGATLHDPCERGAPDLLDQAYVDPAQVRVSAGAERPDLLLVFVESLDENYAHPRPGEAPLLPQLSAWRQGAQTLGELQTLQGAHYTMGALFAALCGLHLQPVGLTSRGDYARAGPFFAGGTCLTDLLAAQGWQLSFHGGASLAFAGKGDFLARHGVAQRFGRDEWAARGLPLPERGWGLLDHALMQQLAQHIDATHGPGAPPQAQLVLTVNTHAPAGAADTGCRDTTVDDEAATLRTALRCSDRVVAALVQRFLARADGRPKLVWLMGDHVTPRRLLDGELRSPHPSRTVFHAVARSDGQGRPVPMPATGARQLAHVDVLPTLAQALGLRWQPQAQRLGLGVSVLAPDGGPTLLEREGADRLSRRLACESPRFQQLWRGTAQGR